MVSNGQLNGVFKIFVESLNDRFLKQIYTTEDSIRYTFFHSLTKITDILPSEIILESPHKGIPGAEVDTFIPSENYVFEFKYDRAIPSGKNLPRPMKAGKVFADLFRLSTFKTNESIRRFFVYVTDGEMLSYYRNKNNHLYDFFELSQNAELEIDENYVNNHCKTFVKSIGANFISCKIVLRLKENIKNQVWIRIYEVFPI